MEYSYSIIEMEECTTLIFFVAEWDEPGVSKSSMPGTTCFVKRLYINYSGLS